MGSSVNLDPRRVTLAPSVVNLDPRRVTLAPAAPPHPEAVAAARDAEQSVTEHGALPEVAADVFRARAARIPGTALTGLPAVPGPPDAIRGLRLAGAPPIADQAAEGDTQILSGEPPRSRAIINLRRGGVVPAPPAELTDREMIQGFLTSPPPLIEDAVRELNGIMPGPFQITQKAVVERLAGLTSPAGVGLAATGAGLPLAAASQSARVAAAAKGANALLSGYFALESGRHVVRAVPEAYAAYQAGDNAGALGKLGEAGTSAFLGTIAAKHAKGQISDLKAMAATRLALQARLNEAEFARRQAEGAEQAGRPRLTAGTELVPIRRPRAAPVEARPLPAVVEQPLAGARGAAMEQPLADARGSETPARAGAGDAAGVPARVGEGNAARLPRDLAGAAPRYTSYPVSFADDVDKAAYIAAQKTLSKRDQDYVAFVEEQTGLEEGEVRALGGMVRAQLRGVARAAEPGAAELRLDPVIRPFLERQRAAGNLFERAAEEAPPQAPSEAKPATIAPSKPQAAEPPPPRLPASETASPGAEQSSGAGALAELPVKDIRVDPARFQFKANVGRHGVGDEMRAVTKFDPEKSGVIAVWRDPADGQPYVVNGHHRLDLARRTGAETISARYLKADNATEARTKGALINIAEGRGESTDAAKVFRDAGLEEASLAREGVSLKGKVASEGLALAKLDPHLFSRVVSGDLSAARGAVIGGGLQEHADQRALADVLAAREKAGKRLTNDQVGEMIRLSKAGPRRVDVQESLFGEQEVTRSLIAEKAEVSDYVRKQLSQEKSLFGIAGKAANAKKLSEAGNTILGKENEAMAGQASQALGLYDKLSSLAGPVSDTLSRAATSLAEGETPHDVKQRAYRDIRRNLTEQAARLQPGGPAGGVRGAEELGTGRPRGVGRGQHDQADGGGSASSAQTKVTAQAQPAQAQPAAAAPPPLPRLLAGAKPRYALHELTFESDVDKAAYIALQNKKSKQDSGYLAYAMDATGRSAEQVRAHGDRIRGLLKDLAAGADPGAPLRVPKTRMLAGGGERGSLPVSAATARRIEEMGERVMEGGRVLRDFAGPAGSRIAWQGPDGVELKRLIDRAFDVGEVKAGKRVVQLVDAKLADLDRAEKADLLDALEGRIDQATQKVSDVHDVVRAVLDEMGAAAVRIGVQSSYTRTIWPGEARPAGLNAIEQRQLDKGRPVRVRGKRAFRARQDYFPHVIPDETRTKKGQIREDIVANLVRQGIRPDAESAAAFLDEYRAYIRTGARQQSLMQHLVNSGQARDAAEALNQLQRYRQKTIKRAGSLEFEREVDLPFYDPDPARVLPAWIAQDSVRLTQIQMLGQDHQRVNRLIKRIRDAGGDADSTRKAVDAILNMVNEGKGAEAQLSRFVRTANGFKLGLASIANSTQGALNTYLASDLPSTIAGVRGMFTREGRRFGTESGAALESVINESLRHAGASGKLLGKYLWATGFTATERLNRITAASGGARYAQRMLQRLAANSGDGRARKVLSELGLDPDKMLRQGQLEPDDVLLAAKKFSDLTQFRSRPQDVPLFASTTGGKVFFQFKSYIYGQTRLIGREFWDEARAGRWGRAARTFLILAIAFPIAGEGVKDLRAWITGKERKEKGFWRWLDDVAQVGAMGMLGDLVEAGHGRRGTELLAGPALGDLGEIIDWTGQRGRAVARSAFRRLPLVGPLLVERLPWFRKKKGGVLDAELKKMMGE